jgi:methionine-rich copper-binding protein CopC
MAFPIETDIQPAPPTPRTAIQHPGWRALPPAEGSIRRIAIRTIRPTQITVGFREIEEKRRRYREALAAGRIALPRQPVPVVLGPDATPYALDRHHWLCALIAEDVDMVTVCVVDDLSGLKPTAFWRTLEQRGWCHPYDQNGLRQGFDAIPASLENLQNDPFRSLASALRRAGGFEKDRTLFSEFRWATYLRGRVDPSELTGDFEGAVATALRLTRRRSGPASPRPGSAADHRLHVRKVRQDVNPWQGPRRGGGGDACQAAPVEIIAAQSRSACAGRARHLRARPVLERIPVVDGINLRRDILFNRNFLSAAGGIAAAAALLIAGQAAAHASLVKSDPPANATVASPKTITLTFDEELTPAFSGFDVVMSDGMKMKFKTTVSKDHKTITGVSSGPLMAGPYKIAWHAAAADDGHKTTGTLAFTVK